MSRRNITNTTTSNGLTVNGTTSIRGKGNALVIYNTNINAPEFTFNTETKNFTINGDLKVQGSATFETVTISELAAGMISLANNNPGDTYDIGLNGTYNTGSALHTGIIRDSNDALRRWTFFKDITTPPTTNVVTGITSANLDSVRMDRLYVNDGSSTTPSITFHNDSGYGTGLFLVANGEMGISAGGIQIMDIKYNNLTSTQVSFNTNTLLKFSAIDVTDSSSTSTIGVNTGHIYLSSASGFDKWFEFYSGTNLGTPSYAGAVFTSPNNNYFILNTGTNLEIDYNNIVTSSTSSPDFRNSIQQLVILNSTSVQVKQRLYIQSGTVGSPGISFQLDQTTGIYSSGANSLAIATNGSYLMNLTSSGITSAQPMYYPNGTVSAPVISFTSNSGTGIWRDTTKSENIAFSANGTSLGYFLLNSGVSQWITGGAGTLTYPTIAFGNDTASGFYSPVNESSTGQISVSLQNTEIMRFRGRSGAGSGSIQMFNTLLLTPDGANHNVFVQSNDSRFFNILKARETWVQSYNLIDKTPVVLYTFRSANAVGYDYSGNGNNATLVGSPTTSAIVIDNVNVVKRDVLNLTGNTSKYLSLTNYVSSFASLSDTTVSFWFKISGSLTTDNAIFTCYQTSNGKSIYVAILSDSALYPNALQVTIESNTLTTMQYHTATASDIGTPSPVAIKDGNWHHAIIHFGSGVSSGVSKQLIYLDGVSLTVASNQIYFTSTGNNSGNPSLSTNTFSDLTFNIVTIGARFNGSFGAAYYTGYLKDFYVTGKLVNPSEVSCLSTEPYLYTYGLDAAVIKTSQLNISGSVGFPDGTAASPSIAFSSEPTGLFKSSAATHALGFSVNGTEQMSLTTSFAQLYSNFIYIDPSLYWFQLSVPTIASNPKFIFNSLDINARHSIQTFHSSTATANSIDFYLYDGLNVDGNGVGSNHIAKWSVTNSVSNSALYTLYGIQRSYNGTVSVPTYSFSNSIDSGLYLIAAGDIGFAASGVLKLEANTVITIGNARGDTVTRLYAPIGSVSLPSYSFIGDITTGIYSTSSGNIDFTCSSTRILNTTSSSVNILVPTTIYNTGSALTIGQTGGAISSVIFTADTSNNRVGIGYTACFLSKYDVYNSSSTQRFLIDTSSAISSTSGLMILNSSSSFTGASTSILTIGKDYTNNYNAANISFYYSGSSSTSNQLQIGIFGIGANQLSIKADGSVNVTGTFTVSSTSTFSGQIQALSGTNSAPSYSFISSTGSGIYYSGSSLAFSYATTKVLDITDTYVSYTQPVRIPNGTNALPSLAFNSNTSSGLYYISSTSFGISTNGITTWTFNTSAPHQCLNELYLTPNGSNIRVYVQDSKFQASSNQTILQITPLLHFRFINDISNTTSQDESINKAAILSTSALYLSSTTPLISLTDSAGNGLLAYNAVQFVTQGTDRIQTSGSITNFSLVQNFAIMVKFKLTNNSSGSIFEIYTNYAVSTASNFIKLSISSGTLNFVVNSTANITATSASTFSNNTWYSLVITFNSSGHSITSNGTVVTLNYTTGNSSTQISPSSSFTSTANTVVIVGGNTSSALGYFAEFYISPITTSQTVTSANLYKIQTHELYVNKIQLGLYSGLVDEGYILRSDKGNNLTWDNSMQIYSTYIQLNNSKTFRLSGGTAALPSYAFTSINDGFFLAGTNTLGFSTNGVQRASISTNAVIFDSSCNITINNSTVPTNSSTGALIITGGIGLGNGSSTASSINFGSSYTISSNSSKMIALYDATGNQHQFTGLGINSNIFNIHAASSSFDFVYYVGASSSSSTEIMRIKGTGVIYGVDGTASNPTYSFSNSTGSGIYRTGTSNNIGISTSSSQRVNISDSSTNILNDLQISQGFKHSVTVISGTSATLDSTDNIVVCTYATDTTNVNITLPLASSHIGREYIIVKYGNTASNVVIGVTGGDLIDDKTSISIQVMNDRITVISIASGQWLVV